MAVVVERIKLGSKGLEVSKQGLGCMGMSSFYGPPKSEEDKIKFEEDMIKLIRHAVDSGVTFLDTSDSYGPHTNEKLLGKALKDGYREKVVLATKFGIGGGSTRGDPAYVREACEASLGRLGVEYIDLYYVHRIDIKVPIEVTIGELKKLVEEGKIKYIGLSEACESTIRRAHAVYPITAVQLEWSLWSRDIEDKIIPTCKELGIGIVAYSPLGTGFLSSGQETMKSKNDVRKFLPRFQGENLENNIKVFESVSKLAAKKGCKTAQLALAWVHHKGNDVAPIPGTTKIQNFDQNIGALAVKLTAEEIDELDLVDGAVKGKRYDQSMVDDTWEKSETLPLSEWKREVNPQDQ